MNTSSSNASFIYIRVHETYDIYDACKLGHTNNIPDRDSTYATGEIKRGHFKMVFQILKERHNIVHIERLLQNSFKNDNVIFNAGTEFYKKGIMILIEPTLKRLNIEYKKLSDSEIRILTRINRVKNSFEKIIRKIKRISASSAISYTASYNPRDYQQIIIDNSVNYYSNNSKGLLVLTCGIGKTLISLWIAKGLNADTIIIGVPNLLLLNQWKNVCNAIFIDIPCLIVCDNIDVKDIEHFIKCNSKFIIITTYLSAHKVNKAACSIVAFSFHMKINDECHHLTSLNSKICENTKQYIQMLNIPSNKQISLTATPKHIIQTSQNVSDTSISNDNIDYFGDIIERRCLLWAINEDIICDYEILTIIANEEQLEHHLVAFNIIEEHDKRLFLSAFAALKSIAVGHSHHLLIYSNNTTNSLKIIEYIKMLMDDKYFDIPNLYYSNYQGDMRNIDQQNIISSFEKACSGIISCVYCLGEGWDFPLLDAVVFSENMTSNIRIVQSALRASRKDKDDITKKTKIILPILYRDDWLDNRENQDLKKIREVIYHMGLEDETITQKIKVYKIDIEKQQTITRKIKELTKIDDFGEYDEELTTQLRLKTIKRIALDITYLKAKKIIADKQIKSKDDYMRLCEKDARLSTEPEELYKGQFKSWVDYLSIDRVYYDLETCKNKVKMYISLKPEIKKHYLDLSIVCNMLCELDALFPPFGLWVDYYNVKDLRDIIVISLQNKKKGGIVL
jgi:superfamily II DNA or RNA helicase